MGWDLRRERVSPTDRGRVGDPEEQGARIHGRPVLGPLSSLPTWLEKKNIDEVLVALNDLSGEQLSKIISLCENSSAHLSLVPQIALAFGDLVDRREGISKVRITTAIALKDSEERDLVSRLERESGRKLRATFAVDPTLIGGAKVQIGDHLIDSSVRAKLVALGRQLAS